MIAIYRQRLTAAQLSDHQRQQLQQQYQRGDYVLLDYDMRQRSRFRAVCQNGAAIGIDLPRTATLKHGDVVSSDDGALLQIFAAPQQLLRVTADSDFELMRAAYHLGNRHVPLMLAQQAGKSALYFEPDSVLAEMLRQLGGIQVAATEAAFEPESGAYQHHHAAHTPLAVSEKPALVDLKNAQFIEQ